MLIAAHAITVGGTDKVRTVDFVGTGYQINLVRSNNWVSVLYNNLIKVDYYLCKHETKSWGHFIESLKSTLSMPTQ